MKLLSVNVGLPRKVRHGLRTVETGIYKLPVAGRVELGAEGLAGDGQADHRFHGGPDKAVYFYPSEHYDHWRRELGRDDLGFGHFGENFTVEGMLEDHVRIGDVYRIGSARLQVTSARLPCGKLALRMGSPGFPRVFLKSGRVGFYARVLDQGEVGTGDAVEALETDPSLPTVAEDALSRAP